MRNQEAIDGHLHAVADIPESNGSRYFRKSAVRIGIICDRFYYDSMSSAADFVYLSPDAPDDILSTLDMLLVVSSWRGLKDDEWRKLYSARSRVNAKARRIIARCRKLGKPTVFYSKEDPPNYHHFLNLAKGCDCVLTTAQECVDCYRRDCGHDRVHVLPFCIDPVVHNPIGSRFVAKRAAVIFAGSWIRKYPLRCRELGEILDGVVRSGVGLDIIDRNSFRANNWKYRYPRRFRRLTSAMVGHRELFRICRMYDWAVNVNSVRRSSTMFANRVYELQATGNLLISNPSPGMIRSFPGVFVARRAGEVGEILRAFTPQEVYALQMAGVRRVMSGETCYDRLAELLQRVGLPSPVTVRRVLVVADDVSAGCRKMFDAQTYPHRTFRRWGEVTAADWAGADAIAVFGSGLTYSRYYLEDMMNAFKYTACDYVVCGGLREHDFTGVTGAKERMLFWRESFSFDRIRNLKEGESVPNGYVIDGFSCGSREAIAGLERAIGEKMRVYGAKVLPGEEPTGKPEFAVPGRMTVLARKLCKLPLVGGFFRRLRKAWGFVLLLV